MPQGVIKKIVADRGFGFISADGQDVFFHHSTIGGGRRFDDLQEGQTVVYELEQREEALRSGKGPRAASVTPV